MLKRALGRLFMRLTGWKIKGGLPTLDKYVLIAAPHTSNWDLVHMLAIASCLDLKVHWLGKDALFRPPLGFVLKWLGGIAIDRSKANNVVQGLANEFAARETLALAVPPSGTRSRREYWKSGFYHIARTANVPIVMGFLDYGPKEGGFGPHLTPTDDMTADMDQIRAFYATVDGKFPEMVSAPRLRDEDVDPTS
ncbi:MAG: lysophospholipid acyltransferase family protein [Myxococcota bacterium]|nr:lysophospholipid acyltransferase family protein [Myxococcota bacterium]